MEAHRRGFESDAGATDIWKTENGKHFGAHFPHVRTAPLHHMGGMRQVLAKLVVIIEGHSLNLSENLTCDKVAANDGIDNSIRLILIR